MTMQIGPIPLTIPMEQDYTRSNDISNDPTVNDDNIVHSPGGQGLSKYNVKVIVPPYVLPQLEGLSEWKQVYPIILDELFPDKFGISGYGYIHNVKLSKEINPDWAEVSFDLNILEVNTQPYLFMNYTKGSESGAILPMTYDDMVDETLFQDIFTIFNTDTAWEAPISSGLTGFSITADGKLNLTGAATTNNVLGRGFTVTQDPIKPPFTFDFDMEWLRYATTYMNRLSVSLYEDKPTSIDEKALNTQLELILQVESSSVKLMYVKRIEGKQPVILGSDILSITEKNPHFRITVDARGYITIKTDPDDSGDYGKVWGNGRVGLDVDEGLYVGICLWNYKNTSETLKMDNVNLYNSIKTSSKNIVYLPVTAGSGLIPDYHRNGEEGPIYYYINPNGELPFTIDPYYLYRGSVKVFNKNNEVNTYRQVFNSKNALTKTSWYASNSLLKLETDSDNNINFSHWNNETSTYDLLNSFYIGDINFVKPFYISPDRCIIQINHTYWTLFRGKQHVLVNHPFDDIGYVIHTCYYHDGGYSASPSAHDPLNSETGKISMQSDFYCNIWNKGTGTCPSPSPEVNYRLQIVKTEPCDIYSDYIPASSYTGIGWYDDRTTPTSPNGYIFNAREFFNPVDQRVTL